MLSSIFLTAATSYAQDETDYNAEFYKDSLLKGSYIIRYTVDDSTQHLFLRKNGKTITELYSCDKSLLAKNLGYVRADFQNCFVFVNAYGPCNPIDACLINKKDGRNLLRRTVALLDVDTNKGIILYTSDTAPENLKMTLYNIHTGKKENFKCPKDVNIPTMFCSIQILKLTKEKLTIKYQSETSEKSKTYKRH